jgi:hypothetical protein
MGVATAAAYRQAVRKLFPSGGYWDAQFADARSDTALFAEAKAGELLRFRARMDALINESLVEKTDECVADWERVLLGGTSPGLSLNERRLQLFSKRDAKLNRAELRKTAEVFGLSLLDVVFPSRPAFAGHSRFNARNGGPAAFSILRFDVTGAGVYRDAWEKIKAELARAAFGRMRFGITRAAYFPAYYLKEYVYKSLREGAAGGMKCGVSRLIPSPVYEIRPVIEHRLRRASFGAARCGSSRLVYSPLPRYRDVAASRMGRARCGVFRLGHDRVMFSIDGQVKIVVYNWFRLFGAGFMGCGRSRLFNLPDAASGAADDSVRAVVKKNGVVQRCDPKIVDALMAVSGFLPVWDGMLIRALLEENGLTGRFDNYVVSGVAQQRLFYPRLEHLLVNRYIRLHKVYGDFETATRGKLLANQNAYFNYEGE